MTISYLRSFLGGLLNHLFIKVSFVLASLVLVFQFSACDSGDDPFRYNGVTPSRNAGTGGGTAGSSGSGGGGSGGLAGSGGMGGSSGSGGTGGISSCTSNEQCSSGQVCDAVSHRCIVRPPEGTCEALFNASLSLKIDDGTTDSSSPELTGHYDSPPTCSQYAGRGIGRVGPVASASLNNFLQAPSASTDLYCCQNIPREDTTVTGITLPDTRFTESLFCSADNRHGGEPQLAAARWKGDGPIHLRFQIGRGGSPCRVFLDPQTFPNYKIENSALTASLIINADVDYQRYPGALNRPLNDPSLVFGNCIFSGDRITIDPIPLRFFVKLYKNTTQRCLTEGRGLACQPSFVVNEFFRDNAFFNGNAPGSFQVIPGFGNSASFSGLTTAARTVNPQVPSLQSSMTVTGSPLQVSGGQARMKLVATYSFPQPRAGFNVNDRNDERGEGQMLQQLTSAILGAELQGLVTKPDGTAITTLNDLAQCSGTAGAGGTGGSGGTGGGGSVQLRVQTNFDSVTDDPPVTASGSGSTQTIAAETCIGGIRSGNDCRFNNLSLLPFARGMTPPVPGLEARFIKEGTLAITNNSDAQITLSVPARSDAFVLTTPVEVQNRPLRRGQTATINVRFEPQTTGQGCQETSGVVTCTSQVNLSTSPTLRVTLRAGARVPGPDLRVEEINPANLNVIGTLLPQTGTTSPSIDFGEATGMIEKRTKVFRITNTGVTDLEIAAIDVQNAVSLKNFRSGPVYVGGNLNENEWRVAGTGSIRVAPQNSFGFFFVNYGPVGGGINRGSGRATCGTDTTQPTRCDAGSLVIRSVSRGIDARTIPLRGRATRDTRAVVEMYIQDESLPEALRSANPPRFMGSEHLELVKKPADTLFSLRQDSRSRGVYLRNGGVLDNLILSTRPTLTGMDTAQFGFMSALALTFPLTIPPGEIVRIGTLDQRGAGSGGYQKFIASLDLNIRGCPPSISSMMCLMGMGSPPVLGGYVGADGRMDRRYTAPAIGPLAIRIGRSVRAPHGPADLKIHRLFAGLNRPLIEATPTLVSSTTRGITVRRGLTPEQQEQFTEVYTLPNAARFDANAGTIILNPIITAIDATSWTSRVAGVRLFNGPGSSPSSSYQFFCQLAPTSRCGYFYVYLGDWSSTTRRCEGGRSPITANPADGGATPAAVDPRTSGVIDSCLRHSTNGVAPAVGLYDTVTGEITFNNIALRLFAPSTPGLAPNPALGEVGGADIDVTLQVALTTECLTDTFVPDSEARASRLLVDVDALTDTLALVTNRGLPNPLGQYLGGGCVPNELHGRRMFVPDGTNTLDNEMAPVGPFNFDLSGLGKTKGGRLRDKSPVDNANGKMMYIVIKAEAIPR